MSFKLLVAYSKPSNKINFTTLSQQPTIAPNNLIWYNHRAMSNKEIAFANSSARFPIRSTSRTSRSSTCRRHGCRTTLRRRPASTSHSASAPSRCRSSSPTPRSSSTTCPSAPGWGSSANGENGIPLATRACASAALLPRSAKAFTATA